MSYRTAKFNVVEDHFYGPNEPRKSSKERAKNSKVTKFEDLIIYRGHHICNSKTFTEHLPKLFISSNEVECDKLLNIEFWKIKKLKNPER